MYFHEILKMGCCYDNTFKFLTISLCFSLLASVMLFLAYWLIGHKLLAWPGVGVGGGGGSRRRHRQFFQPVLLRNYCIEYFKIIYTASSYRGL